MPWTATVSLDDDKTSSGAEVGAITGTYTDADVYAITPFTVSLRTEFKTSEKAGIVAKMRAALAAEIAKRTREQNVGAALVTALNS